MSTLRTFLLARLEEDENAVRTRDMSLPIHFVGCWYYNHNLDAFTKCDCDEDGEASKKALAEIKAKRNVIEQMTVAEDSLIVQLLAEPYSEHPDYTSSLA